MRLAINRPASRGFTLVELLVVIGIIALLISILLPVLGKAKAQANMVKCATQLKEIGNAFQMYANEYHGYAPPAQIQPNSGETYTLGNVTYPVAGTSNGAYWYDFLSKYVTKQTGGVGGTGATAQAFKNRSVIWGCTEWDAYSGGTADTAAGVDFNRAHPGYGMNGYPYFGHGYPSPLSGAAGAAANAAMTAYAYKGDTNNPGWARSTPSHGFIKFSAWTREGASRILVADASLWLVITNSGINGNRGAITGQPPQMSDAANVLPGAGQTDIGLWRHGKLPAPSATTPVTFDPTKGRIAFNALYSDGHVATATDYREAWLGVRREVK